LETHHSVDFGLVAQLHTSLAIGHADPFIKYYKITITASTDRQKYRAVSRLRTDTKQWISDTPVKYNNQYRTSG